MLIVKKGKKFVFDKGKHVGQTLEEVAEENPGYLKWAFNDASDDLPSEVHEALEDVMEEYGIEP